MKNILFRCDASLLIGSGHVIRCRTLARMLKQGGATITFLCRRQAGDLIYLLKNEFRVLELQEQTLSNCKDLKERDLYAAWLGCSQEKDAEECLKLLFTAGLVNISWIVVDHYGLGHSWEKKLLRSVSHYNSTKLLAIDDLADRRHLTNILLDQNFFGNYTERRYSGLVPEHCLQLLGPQYALLSPEYAQLHPLVPPRVELKRILVFFGGVDHFNLTSRALKVLRDPSLASLAIDVVLGLQSPHIQTVVNLVETISNCTIHAPLPSLAGLITRADISVGAAGGTTWERACLGLPSLVVPIAENQLNGAEALENKDCIILLRSNFEERLRESLTDLISDSSWLFSASTKAARMVSGNGTKLIARRLLENE